MKSIACFLEKTFLALPSRSPFCARCNSSSLISSPMKLRLRIFVAALPASLPFRDLQQLQRNPVERASSPFSFFSEQIHSQMEEQWLQDLIPLQSSSSSSRFATSAPPFWDGHSEARWGDPTLLDLLSLRTEPSMRSWRRWRWKVRPPMNQSASLADARRRPETGTGGSTLPSPWA